MQLIVVSDQTNGLITPTELWKAEWALCYQALYHYNRSPWVERGYAQAIESVHALPSGVPPGSAWIIRLVPTIEGEGALGFHEDQARRSTPHSKRGLAAETETPLAVVGVKTSQEAGVAWSEVASHEMLEMIVDPYVTDEARMRKYLNHAAREWYIGEVGDPVQERGYDVGAPEKRTDGVIVADFAYPAWWEQQQTRPATAFCSDATAWHTPPQPNLAPFELAPGGYMSVAPEQEPTNWSQVFGSAHKPDRT